MILDEPEIEIENRFSDKAFKNGAIFVSIIVAQSFLTVLLKILHISFQFYNFVSIAIFLALLWFGLGNLSASINGVKEKWTVKKVFGWVFTLFFLIYFFAILIGNFNDLKNISLG